MSHTVREKKKLLARVRRIKGQVDALERALESELGCSEVMQQIASVRGAVNGLMAEVIQDHVRTHILPTDPGDDERLEAAEELIEIIRAYLR